MRAQLACFKVQHSRPGSSSQYTLTADLSQSVMPESGREPPSPLYLSMSVTPAWEARANSCMGQPPSALQAADRAWCFGQCASMACRPE